MALARTAAGRRQLVKDMEDERLRRCLTQGQAAEEIGITRPTVRSFTELGMKPSKLSAAKIESWIIRSRAGTAGSAEGVAAGSHTARGVS